MMHWREALDGNLHKLHDAFLGEAHRDERVEYLEDEAVCHER